MLKAVAKSDSIDNKMIKIILYFLLIKFNKFDEFNFKKSLIKN